MVSGVDTPTTQSPIVEASTNIALINQARPGVPLVSNQLVVGKQFQAEVVAALEDGTYIVKVADVAARMQLPNTPEVGSRISLTLLATTPRASFLLNPPSDEDAETGQAPVTTTATLASSVKQLIDDFNQPSTSGTSPGLSSSGLYLQPGSTVTALSNDQESPPRLITIAAAAPESAPATLSQAGKLVNQIIQTSPQVATASTIGKTMPLVATPEVNINTMVSALQNGVTSSGMFYESHLLQWAEGTLPTEALMKEPQAKFVQPPENDAPVARGAVPNESIPTTNLVKDYSETTSMPFPAAGLTGNPATPGAPTASSNTAVAADPSNPLTALPKEAPPLIQQQLNVMEQQRFVWHGEVWPGQTMNWEIAQDGGTNQNSASQQESSWQSSVKFELPSLGSVNATLHLTGNHIRLKIDTADNHSAILLQNHAHELADALDQAGIQLDSVAIKQRAES